ncbi:MAG: HAMP domain-containing sensor histidine kinase [Dokdonella sp.]
MRYRRRLRSRIIISFALFGLGLTAVFAISAVLLRDWLEDKLIGEALLKNVADYSQQFYADPSQDLLKFQKIQGFLYSERKFANVPFAWRDLPNGVYDFNEPDGKGGRDVYKLAVRKDEHYWFFLQYDTAQEKHAQRLLLGGLVLAVLAFSILSLVIGGWLSARVMSPVIDLARRVQAMSRSGKPEPLQQHFANDEVGQLAATLDDYSGRLTEMVQRDREFNADVSHELRTPLAVIASTTELLQASPELTDKLRERLKRIERAVRQSTELIDALLLLSRRERQAPTDGETTDVAKVVEQVVDAQRPHINNKPVQVRVEIEEPLAAAAPSSVVAVALSNLIGNAFKYTQAGEVIVSVGHGRVTIEDTGPGIKPEDADKLFERGVRGTTIGKGGGLGLAIVRRLCELYGWEVSLAPRPQGGATATLDFGRQGYPS